jgi:hypothetical protein
MLDMQYVIPEWQYGVEWRIPKTYTVKDLERLLANPPCIFNLHSAGETDHFYILTA